MITDASVREAISTIKEQQAALCPKAFVKLFSKGLECNLCRTWSLVGPYFIPSRDCQLLVAAREMGKNVVETFYTEDSANYPDPAAGQ